MISYAVVINQTGDYDFSVINGDVEVWQDDLNRRIVIEKLPIDSPHSLRRILMRCQQLQFEQELEEVSRTN